ncbi:hypothetical protein D3C85_736940 [compost metagenome]
MIGQGQRRVGSLGNEYRGNGVVDRLPVRVEGEAGGNDHPGDGFGHPGLLHFGNHLWQHRLRRTGTQHGEQLFLDELQELPQAESAVAADRAEDEDHEHGTGEIDASHQLAQREQRAEAILADREGDGTKCANRCQAHDHVDDAEHTLHQAIERIDECFAPWPYMRQGDAQQNGKQQDLQHIALGEGIHDGVGDDVHDEVHERCMFHGRGVGGQAGGVEGGDIDVHAGTGFEHIDHHQADHQRQGRDHFEIEQGPKAHTPQFLHVFHAGNPCDHGQEDHRSEEHLDQFDEGIAQGFERSAGFGNEHADDGAEDHGDQHLHIEFAEYSFHDRALIFYCCQEMPRSQIN